MTGSGARLLVVANHFAPNHGGTPESILLLGKLLADQDVAVDVMAGSGLFVDVAVYPRLPLESGRTSGARQLDLSPYTAIFIAGPWNRLTPIIVLRARRLGIFVTYAGKGGLARIEFERWRDLKKLVYLTLVEGPIIRLCHRFIHTSALERDQTILPRWLRPASEVVLSEPFSGPDDHEARLARPAQAGMVLGFLAEIAPRKGLLELLHGFAAHRRDHPDDRATLVIAGAPRPGGAAYMRQIEALAGPLEAAGWVRRIGARRGIERDLFYREIDVFIVPSRFESFGLTPLEALWHGTPVMVSPHLGLLDFMPPRPACLVLRDLTPVGIAVGLAGLAARYPIMRADAQALAGRRLPPFAGTELALAYLAALTRDPAGNRADRAEGPLPSSLH